MGLAGPVDKGLFMEVETATELLDTLYGGLFMDEDTAGIKELLGT